MSRIDKAMELVKEYRTGKNRSWIYDENGNIKNAVLADVLPIMEELKEYEIGANNEFINNVLEKAKDGFNTYNWNAPISNDIACHYIKLNDDSIIAIMMVHLAGDIRANYTDWFAVKLDSYEELLELESMYQVVDIDDRYMADVCIWSDTFNVYDTEELQDVGEFYEIDLEDLKKEIKKMRGA